MHATGSGHEHAHHDEPSRWPFFVGFGMAIFTLGLALGPAVTLLGAVVLFIGIYGWVAQDVAYWRDNFDFAPYSPGRFHPDLQGVMYFLGTEIMFFGGLFAFYFYSRAYTPGFITGGDLLAPGVHLPVLATGINTLILVASSGTIHWAEHAIRKGNRKGLIAGLALTLVLGAIFLVGQVMEYVNLYAEGFKFAGPTATPFSAIFYGLTGVHGLHVLGGLLFILVIFLRAVQGQFDGKRHVGLQSAALYWHFVDVVWIFLFATLYLRLW